MVVIPLPSCPTAPLPVIVPARVWLLLVFRARCAVVGDGAAIIAAARERPRR